MVDSGYSYTVGECQEELQRVRSRLARAEALLEKTRQGYINLIDVKALPHEEWDDVARGIAEEIDVFLQGNPEPGKPDEDCPGLALIPDLII